MARRSLRGRHERSSVEGPSGRLFKYDYYSIQGKGGQAVTRIMYDGIYASDVPAGAQLYASYVDGDWPDYPAMAAKFPNAVHVSVAVTASYNGGKALDVENGDATPAQSVDWVIARRADGQDPTVYCSVSNWPAVKSAFAIRSVSAPHYWVADYSLGDNPSIPDGAVALQYTDKGGYDISVVADYWPGVDPVPVTTIPEEDMPYLISVTPDPTNTTDTADKGSGIFSVDGGTVVHVPTTPDETNLASRFGAPIVTSPARYAALIAAQPGVSSINTAELAASLVSALPAAPTTEAIASAVLKAQSAAEAAG